MASETERFAGDAEYGLSRRANDMLTEIYRKPFVVHGKV
jgi:hypothetical protein